MRGLGRPWLPRRPEGRPSTPPPTYTQPHQHNSPHLLLLSTRLLSFCGPLFRARASGPTQCSRAGRRSRAGPAALRDRPRSHTALVPLQINSRVASFCQSLYIHMILGIPGDFEEGKVERITLGGTPAAGGVQLVPIRRR